LTHTIVGKRFPAGDNFNFGTHRNWLVISCLYFGIGLGNYNPTTQSAKRDERTGKRQKLKQIMEQEADLQAVGATGFMR